MSDDDKSWADAVELRDDIQSGEKDSRESAIAEARFNAQEYGHWEEYAENRFKGKPKYQIDLIKPIIDSIAGEIEQKEIGGQVIPVGSDANEKIALTYEKMIRTISNMSDATDIFSDAGRNIVDHAYDACMVQTDWADVDAFEQDIIIEKIPDAINRVWMDATATATKPSDYRHGFVDTALSLRDYKDQFPDGSLKSLSEFSHNRTECNAKKDVIIVSDYYYIKDTATKLHLLSDNRVITDDEYQRVQIDLNFKGIVSTRSKTRKLPTCFMRKMDGGGWLTEAAETIFSYIPVVQFFGNFQVLDGRPYYSGETLKLMDAQRIYDYGTSKDINDGALGRKDKIVMSPEQAEGHEAQNARLNTQDDPILLANHVDGQVPPHVIQGSQMDVGLQNTLNRTQQDMQTMSMSHQPQQGMGIQGHSGKAYEILKESSNTGAYKYVKALEKGVGFIYTIVIDAIPKSYDTKNRQMRLTNEDGSSKFEAINEEVRGNDGSIEIVNDLSHGHYMFKVTTGPAFSSRRAEGVAAIKEWAALDPSIVEEGKDIIYSSLNAPGVKDIAERVRKRMLEEGRVPEGQLTDEEREKIQQEIEAAQNQPPNPMDEVTVQAILKEIENIDSQMQERQDKLALEAQESSRKMMETLSRIEQGKAKLDSDIDNKDADTLNKLREASGADVVVNENVAEAYNDVAEGINQGQ